MTLTISAAGFAISILVVLATILVAYLVITLRKINITLDKISSLLDSNKNNIDTSLKSLPDICDNINSITKSVRGKTDMLDQYLEKDEETAASLDIESLLSGITSIIDVVSQVKGYFGRKKKKFYKRAFFK